MRLLTLATAAAFLAAACGDSETTKQEQPGPKIESRTEALFKSGPIGDPADPFAEVGETVVEVVPKAAGYDLPLDLAQVANLDRDIRGKDIHAVDGDAATKLAANGFVVVPTPHRMQRFSDAYEWLEQSDVPIVVTTDSTLHLYHLFFGQILKYLEATEFVPLLESLLSELVLRSMEQQAGFEGELEEAARRNVAYFAVALKLLDPGYSLPDGVTEAADELALIEAHEEMKASPLFNYDCPDECDPCSITPGDVRCQDEGACTCEDYTQYIPRGHYTTSEDLKRYFKAMMWLGRLGFRLKSPMETRQAVLATDALNRSTVDVKGTDKLAAEVWHRIYDVTGFLVGNADDLTFFEYQDAVAAAFGEGFDMASLEQDETMSTLVEKLRELRKPGILGGFLSAFLDQTEHTQGWRFMGQRFVPDSYVLGQMVWPHVGPDLSNPVAEPYVSQCKAGATCEQVMADLDLNNCICFAAMRDGHPEVCRLMPKGLDVMATLGSSRAPSLLEPDRGFCGFEEQLAALTGEMEAYDRAAWRQNVYWYWLDVLKPLLERPAEGYPNWSRTDAWLDRTLNTALTSWAELRHDTILYVKQSYTPMLAGSGPPPSPEALGYVEPLPVFYARLGDLSRFTKAGLKQHDALPVGLEPHLDAVAELLDDLVEISKTELAGAALSDPQVKTIRTIGARFSGIIDGLAAAVTVEDEPHPECEENPDWCMETSEVVGDPYKTAIVADVHTDLNTKRVLEEGSGYLDLMIVAHELPDGTIGAAVGPVFSYYEFPHPYDDRLTDEAWGKMLKDGPPDRPAWTSSFRADP